MSEEPREKTDENPYEAPQTPATLPSSKSLGAKIAIVVLGCVLVPIASVIAFTVPCFVVGIATDQIELALALGTLAGIAIAIAIVRTLHKRWSEL